MPERTPEEDEYNYYDDYWRCGRDGGCGQKAGWGTDHVGVGACQLHGGASDGAPTGEDHGNYKHGAYSKKVRETLSDEEEDALDDAADALSDPEAAEELIREQVAELLLMYRRSKDPKFLREARQLLSEFNIVDATDHVEHHGDLSLSGDEKEQLRKMFDREVQE